MEVMGSYWADTVCSVEGCDQRTKSNGLCNRHVLRWRRYGDPLAGAPFRDGTTKDRQPRPTTVPCQDCGTVIATKRVGRLPSLCVECLRKRDDRRKAERQARTPEARAAAFVSSAFGRRFWSKVAITDDCWEWTASLDGKGYGKFFVAGVLEQAHRVSYELRVGPIPDGLELDHLCRNRRCVRPDHLEPVTARVNVLRGISPMAKQAQQTHCKRGHEFTTANTYYWSGQPNQRKCRACRAARSREARCEQQSSSPTDQISKGIAS